MVKKITISSILVIIQADYLATIDHLVSPNDIKLAKKLNKKGLDKLSSAELDQFVRVVYADDALVNMLVQIELSLLVGKEVTTLYTNVEQLETKVEMLTIENDGLKDEVLDLRETLNPKPNLNIKFVGGNWVKDGKSYTNLDDAKNGKNTIEG